MQSFWNERCRLLGAQAYLGVVVMLRRHEVASTLTKENEGEVSKSADCLVVRVEVEKSPFLVLWIRRLHGDDFERSPRVPG